MKKLSELLSIFFILLILVACQNECTKENTPDIECGNNCASNITEGDSTDDGDVGDALGGKENETPNFEDVEYVAYDMNTFLNDLKNSQTSGSENADLYIPNNTSSSTISIKIPVLQNDKYEFYQVLVNEWSYFYYYAPIEIKVNGVFDKGTVLFHTIVVSISKYPMTFEEGYHSSSHSWVFNDNGKAISVSFPKHTVLESANDVSDYFTFENYVISTNNSTETE